MIIKFGWPIFGAKQNNYMLAWSFGGTQNQFISEGIIQPLSKSTKFKATKFWSKMGLNLHHNKWTLKEHKTIAVTKKVSEGEEG